jgi:ribosomal protein S11
MGRTTKEQTILHAIMQGIENDDGHRALLEEIGVSVKNEAAKDVIEALAEAGFRITKIPTTEVTK